MVRVLPVRVKRLTSRMKTFMDRPWGESGEEPIETQAEVGSLDDSAL